MSRERYSAIETLSRLRQRWCAEPEMQDARRLLSEAIREMRRVWRIELPKQGLDYTDFFTYENTQRPDWMRRKQQDSDQIPLGCEPDKGGVKPTNQG